MLFNSFNYLIFFILSFFLYWFVFKKRLAYQNLFLLSISYVFYGFWDWRFLTLIALSTIADFVIARRMVMTSVLKERRFFLAISLILNLGLLIFFKYCNFFIESFVSASHAMGFQSNINTLSIILPVGISFYTFQTLSYTIDVYKGKISPTNNFIHFATYVAFFPQLVAGPIERAVNLLPQFSKSRIFKTERAFSGLHLIIWGLFQKVVIADSCATYVNAIFENYTELNTLTLILGSIYFAFQIYGDFAGYSNIAIGSARLLGFDLMRNFNYPYFSRNIAEFWRRWHISLSTWFRDYLYIPLGGSRGSKANKVRNVFIVFIVSGFWHGANWTFIMWGFLHAVFFLPVMLLQKNRVYLDQVAKNKRLPNFKELWQMTSTFALTCIAWVFFRAKTLGEAIAYFKTLFLSITFDIQFISIERYNIELLLLLTVFIGYEWFNRAKEHPFYGRWRWCHMIFVLMMLLTLGVYSNHQDFIYFQF